MCRVAYRLSASIAVSALYQCFRLLIASMMSSLSLFRSLGMNLLVTENIHSPKDGVDPDFKDRNGLTPLLLAAVNGHEAVVKLLLATDGVDPNSKDSTYGRTPLLSAAANGHEP